MPSSRFWKIRESLEGKRACKKNSAVLNTEKTIATCSQSSWPCQNAKYTTPKSALLTRKNKLIFLERRNEVFFWSLACCNSARRFESSKRGRAARAAVTITNHR